jgi:hypothetical protein
MKIFFKYYLLFILIIPYGLIKITSIYNITTPPVIDYDYLDYNLSLLLLPFFLIFLQKSKNILNWNKQNLLIYSLVIIVILRNIYLMFSSDLELLFTYELVFSLFLGLLLWKTFKYSYKTYSFESFLNSIVLFHLIGIMISLIFSLNKIDFRFNAQNLDVGGTGMIFGLIFLIKIVYYKMDFFSASAFFILLISGSRFCLMLTLLLYVLNIFTNFNFRYLIIIALLSSVILIYIPSILDRYLSSIVELQDVSEKSSFGGRILSLVIGFQVLVDNFFNVSLSSVNLVLLMNKFGYPTYPHSYFLISLIYFPLLAIYIFVKLIMKLTKHKNIINLYVLLIFIFYGGVTYNYKIYALIFILLYIINRLDNLKKNEIFNTQ